MIFTNEQVEKKVSTLIVKNVLIIIVVCVGMNENLGLLNFWVENVLIVDIISIQQHYNFII